MDGIISAPPFPPLKWDGYFWSGEIVLPSWIGFQRRRGAYASVNSHTPSDGSASLTITPLDADARALSALEQAVAFRHMIDNEVSVAAAIGQALLAYYPGEREAYLDAYEEGEVELPEVTELARLRPLIELSSVHVLAMAHGGAAYIGFEFGCEWDGEHGAGVMTHRGRVVAIGQADVSFLAWVAEQGMERS